MNAHFGKTFTTYKFGIHLFKGPKLSPTSVIVLQRLWNRVMRHDLSVHAFKMVCGAFGLYT